MGRGCEKREGKGHGDTSFFIEIDIEGARDTRGQDKQEILPERRNHRAWRSWKLGGLLWEVVREVMGFALWRPLMAI